MKINLPNFIIIGAAKCGTTSVADYLGQHPQIYMCPVKEPRYFAPEYYTEYYKKAIGNPYRKEGMKPSEYEFLFKDVVDEIAIGEASTEYLFFEKSPLRIKEKLPNVKLIAILRNPVERAYSAYCFHIRDGRETLDFEESLRQEPKREKEKWQVGWLYRKGGYYFEQLSRYYKIFEPEQIKILLWDDLNQDPLNFCKEIFEFLEVDVDFIPNFSRSNQSRIPRSKFLNRFLFKNSVFRDPIKKNTPDFVYKPIAKRLKNYFYQGKQEMSLKSRQFLVDSYREDILNLQDLISRDLSTWL